MKKTSQNKYLLWLQVLFLFSCNTDKGVDPSDKVWTYEVINETNAEINVTGFANSSAFHKFTLNPKSLIIRKISDGVVFFEGVMDSVSIIYKDTVINKVKTFSCYSRSENIDPCFEDRNVLSIVNYETVSSTFFRYTFTDEDYEKALPLDLLE